MATLASAAPRDDEPILVESASSLQVALALLIDTALLTLLGTAVAWLWVLLLGDPAPPGGPGAIDRVLVWVAHHVDAVLIGGGLAVLAGVVYSIMSRRYGGLTLGRWASGTVLVRMSGRPLSLPFMIFRAAMLVVSLALFGAGFWWMVLDKHHRSLHDLVAGSVLVRRRVTFLA